MTFRHRTWQLLEPTEGDDALGRWVDIFLMTLILLNVVAVILATVEEIRSSVPMVFQLFDRFSLVVFTAEYGLRLWCCVENPKYEQPVAGRIRYAFTPLALIDLVAILPLLLPFTGADLRSIRAVRLLRMLRVFKFSRYSRGVHVMLEVLKARREELVAALGMLVTLLIVSATVVYFAERNDQPDKFSSIPMAMWWGITTLTTVGYGDLTPVTTLGRIFGAIVSVGGLLLVALPTGIVGAGFVEEFEKYAREQELDRLSGDAEEAGSGPLSAGAPANCPHCGQALGPVSPVD
ncbi:MAG: ion transporter [Myxococcota bacterium]|nr:ion transporter [Myxococcota bacterium]